MNPAKTIAFWSAVGTLFALLACSGGGSAPGAGSLFGGGGGVGEQAGPPAMATGDSNSGSPQNNPLDSGFPDPVKDVPRSPYVIVVGDVPKEDACLLPPENDGKRKAKVKFSGYVSAKNEETNGFSVRVLFDDGFLDTEKTHPHNGTDGWFEFEILIELPAPASQASRVREGVQWAYLLPQPSGRAGIEGGPQGGTESDETEGFKYPGFSPQLLQPHYVLSFLKLPNDYQSPYGGKATPCSADLCSHDAHVSLDSYSYDLIQLREWLNERDPCTP